MSKKFVIGIDIGGTNTDAVLVDQNHKIIKAFKTNTTQDINTGFKIAIQELIAHDINLKNNISGIFVGTTHGTNAILQQKDLFKVGVLRLAGHKPNTLPPCYMWPENIRLSIFAGYEMVDGGYECDGKPITQLNKKEIYEAAKRLISKGAQSIAIIGVFSSLNNEQEKLAKEIIVENFGDSVSVTMSHEVGAIGFIERENSTILNCALKKSLSAGFQNLEDVLNELNITAPLYITQNNGTIISLEKALEYPVLTISAGPTNSFIGAVKLANLMDAIIVDIGGTSTDVGIVKNGFARRSINNSQIAGITLNFAMPDVLSIGLGGGSYITKNNDEDFEIGPESAGRRLFEEAISFKGNKITFTDIALKKKIISIPESNIERINLSEHEINIIYKIIKNKLQDIITKMKGSDKNLPVILVGGGASLIENNFLENEKVIIPEFSYVANAYGAALAEISGTIDTVESLNNREVVLNELKNKAIQEAIKNGANAQSVRIVNIEIIPYNYVANNLARIIVTAAGTK